MRQIEKLQELVTVCGIKANALRCDQGVLNCDRGVPGARNNQKI